MPADEAERMAAVRSYQILDSPPEQEYEDLVSLASTICETPIAVLSIIGSDRQWFKAVVGSGITETSRDIAFCSYTILGSEVLEVRDAASDERFAGNPLVTGDPGIRFYAGAPLRSSDGLAVGTLCVIDRSPRQLRPDQTAALEALSRQATSLLELRKATEELQAREAARAIIDTAGDAFVAMDAAGLITDWNPRAETMFGWSREEAIGQPIGELVVPPAVREVLGADIGAFLAGGPSRILGHRFEVNVRHRDGHLFPVDVILWPMRSGGDVSLNAFVRDRANPVLDLKEIQEVRKAHDLFSSVLGATTEYAIIGTDLEGDITFFNVGAEKMLGYSSAEVVARRTPLFLHDDTEIAVRAGELGVPAGFEALVASARRGQPDTREWTYVRKDGVRLTVSVTVTAIEGGDATPAGFIAIAFDVTERRKADEARSRLAAMVESSDDAMISTDPDGIIRTWNGAAERLFGFRAEEAVGQRAKLIKGEGHEAETAEIMKSLRSNKSVFLDDAVRFHKDGRGIPVALTLSPLWDTQDRFAGASAAIRDITERKKNEAALLDTLARQSELVGRLQELDRAKTDFVSSVSHELRTPLAGMLGYVEMLTGGEAGELNHDQCRILEIVDVCTRRLSLLIEDLLTVSRVESGTFKLDPGPVQFGPLVQAAHQAITPTLVKRRLEVCVVYPDEPTTIWADGSQLERMLINLLTNAVKFTPDGGRVELRWRDVDDGVELTLSDTGIGIPLEEQPMLFERFFRSSGARQLAIPGTGLGLGIVKSIVEEHGGTITITSAPDEGTEVMVTLPRALVAQPDHGPQNQTNRLLAPVERS